MRATLLAFGSTVILLFTAGSASLIEGRVHLHGHKHGDVLGRIMHKPIVSSGSNYLVNATNHPIVGLPMPTKALVDSSCPVEECGTLNATHVLEKPTQITPPAIQLHVNHLELRDDSAVIHPSRRRHHFRSSLVVKELATKIQLDWLTAGAPSTETADVEAWRPHHRSHSITPRQDGGYQSFVLSGFSSPATSTGVSLTADSTNAVLPTTSTAATGSVTQTTAPSLATALSGPASSICPAGNGSIYTSADGIDYQLNCNTDFLDNNLDYQLVGSFVGCVQKCDAWNYNHHEVQCLAALFLPNRELDADDCYLKSKLIDPSAASLLIEGAIRMGYATGASTSAEAVSATSTSHSTAAAPSSSRIVSVSSSAVKSVTPSSAAPTTSSSSISSPGVTYASGEAVVVPKVASSHLQGVAQNTPSQQYLDIQEPPIINLASSLLTVGVNGDLTTGYPISGQTGVLQVNISTQSHLSTLKNTPHLSRDGGRGGMVNGEHVFVFCDTGSYTTTTSSSNGNFLGFVSSSVAIDVGMKGLSGGALNLQDGIGEWSDDAGRMRGFAPLTDGELAYNLAKQGNGQRYAVWPESDIIPLDANTGIMYAPIVYDNVNEVTKAAVFTYTGTTLLKITAGGKGGPIAERTVEKLFQQNEVEWGCAGGIRSWGPSGIGGDDGSVYIFGNVAGGILVARTSPTNIADRNSIQYWDGNSWTSDMQTSSSTAYFIAGAFMDVSVFYSPRHLTFIVVYLTIYADNTFYYRYLQSDQGILPPFAPGGDSSSDYVENILKYKWSEQQVLYKAAPGLSGHYIYSGGPHLGYYGSNDISNGGSKMLLSWSAPTGLDPSTLTSEYQLVTAEVDWA